MISAGATTSAKGVELKPLNGLASAIVDLSPQDSARTHPVTISVSSQARVWGLLTVTDNVSQRVTAFWPQ